MINSIVKQDDLTVHIKLLTAKLAKKKGFDIACRLCLADDDGDRAMPYETGNDMHFNSRNQFYSAPTQAVLAKWIRDVHKLHVYADSCFLKNDDGKFEVKFNGVIKSLSDANAGYDNVYTFGTYEEAMEVVLFDALKMVSK